MAPVPTPPVRKRRAGSKKSRAARPIVIVPGTAAKLQTAFPGLERQVLAYNEHILGAKHYMRAGAVFPWHDHPEDQFAYLISGRIEVRCDQTVFEARGGDSFVIRGGIKHEVRTLEDSIALDVFAPMREDYAKLATW